jgi:hypothetical protein
MVTITGFAGGSFFQRDMVVPGVGPTVTTTNLPDGTLAVPYSQTILADGDTPITWSLLSGSLPTGLSLSSGGVVSGTPTVAGSYSFIVRATNATATDDQPFSITIDSGAGGGGYPRGKRFKWWKSF